MHSVQKDADPRSVIYRHKNIYWFLIPVLIVAALDRWFKTIGLARLPGEGSLVDPGLLEFAIHKNLGIAFNIPFKLELVVIVTLIIGFFLLRIAFKHLQSHPDISFASLVIIIGALGNFFDRVIYGFTVDYMIWFERSAINLSDIIIVTGAILLLLASQRTRKRAKKQLNV